eukprot:3708322-Rhodomonas_salina.2
MSTLDDDDDFRWLGTWRSVDPSSYRPQARAAHTMVLLESQLLLVGGQGDSGAGKESILADFWTYDLDLVSQKPECCQCGFKLDTVTRSCSDKRVLGLSLICMVVMQRCAVPRST